MDGKPLFSRSGLSHVIDIKRIKNVNVFKKKIIKHVDFFHREWPAMYGRWTEYAVLWTNSLGFIWDI